MDQNSKVKFLPLLVTLIAAALTALINLLQQVEIMVFLKRIFFSIIVFYIIGYIVQIVFRIALKNSEDDVGILESEAEDSEASDSEKSSSDDEEEEDNQKFTLLFQISGTGFENDIAYFKH